MRRTSQNELTLGAGNKHILPKQAKGDRLRTKKTSQTEPVKR
jgi:hypothetical protein